MTRRRYKPSIRYNVGGIRIGQFCVFISPIRSFRCGKRRVWEAAPYERKLDFHFSLGGYGVESWQFGALNIRGILTPVFATSQNDRSIEGFHASQNALDYHRKNETEHTQRCNDYRVPCTNDPPTLLADYAPAKKASDHNCKNETEQYPVV